MAEALRLFRLAAEQGEPRAEDDATATIAEGIAKFVRGFLSDASVCAAQLTENAGYIRRETGGLLMSDRRRQCVRAAVA